MKNERILVLVFVVAVILIAVLGVIAARQAPTVVQQNTPPYGRPIFEPKPVVPEEPAPEPVEPEPEDGLTQASCEAGGGTWNECGSACRGAPPGTACILMCVPYCECTTDDQCPANTTCGAFVEGVGVCE